MKYRILIIEDSPDIANLVQLHLKDIHCDSDIAHDGGEGLAMFENHKYDMVILDLMLPVLDGLAVCKALREKPGYVPIIMLTSKSSELDRVLGLELGADDYLTKPFSIPELLARVKSLFRRMDAIRENEPAKISGRLEFNGLVIEPDKHRVYVNGEEISLTAKEFELLFFFARHPGQVYTRVQLLDKVWGYSYEGYEHTVNSHINRLRAKIEVDPVNPRYIMTVWGVGYKFTDEKT